MRRFIFSLFLLMALNAFANDVDVAFIKIPGVLEHNEPNAPYSKLLAKLKSRMTVNGQFYPSARANKLLNSGKLDCIFPILPSNSRPMATILSEPINGIKAYAFTYEDKPYTSIESLQGKTVVYLRGYVFGGLFNVDRGVNFFPVTTQKSALGVLKKGRAEAYLDYIPDLRFALTNAELTALNVDYNSPIISDNDHIECVDKAATRSFLNQINELLNELKSKGEMEILLGKYFVTTQ